MHLSKRDATFCDICANHGPCSWCGRDGASHISLKQKYNAEHWFSRFDGQIFSVVMSYDLKQVRSITEVKASDINIKYKAQAFKDREDSIGEITFKDLPFEGTPKIIVVTDPPTIISFQVRQSDKLIYVKGIT